MVVNERGNIVEDGIRVESRSAEKCQGRDCRWTIAEEGVPSFRARSDPRHGAGTGIAQAFQS